MPKYTLSSELHACTKCGELWSIDLLDGKDDGTGDFNLLECPNCYGPGWNPMVERRQQPWPVATDRRREPGDKL